MLQLSRTGYECAPNFSGDRTGGSKTRPSNNAMVFPSGAKTDQLSDKTFIKL
jgi:hypothetical protein